MEKPQQSEKVYTPSSILITGGAGFICSHVCNYLVKAYPNYNIVCLDILEYCANIKNLSGCRIDGDNNKDWLPNFHFVKGSILNADLVNLLLQNYNIDTVLHFAAQTHVDNSFGNSLEFTQTNVLGTHVLLECSKAHGIKRFIHVSTDEVYGPTDSVAQEKDALLSPTNPYSCSKAGAEFICQAYIRSFHMPIIITRGNNVFGPCQFPEKVIPKFALRLLAGQPCCIHGSGDMERNFIHTSAVVDAFDKILHHGINGEIYNIGTKFEISIRKLALKMIKMIKPEVANPEDLLIEVRDRAFNDYRYTIDSSKLEALGWVENTVQKFDQLLLETIQWYKDNTSGYWPHDITSYLAPHPFAYKVTSMPESPSVERFTPSK